MKNFNTRKEFLVYKAGLKQRIEELESNIDFSPITLLNTINPFKTKSTSLVNKISSGNFVQRQLTSVLINKIFGKKYRIVANALIPIAESGATKAIKEIEKSNFLEKLLDRVIYATSLNQAEEQLLTAAEIENHILEVEEKITTQLP